MPSSKWRGLSIEAPYTDRAAPAERSRNVRRSRPVPAGSGIPGSIDGRPLPATATPLAQQLRAVEVVARAALGHGQLTCMSGEVAISIRSAFWRIAR